MEYTPAAPFLELFLLLLRDVGGFLFGFSFFFFARGGGGHLFGFSFHEHVEESQFRSSKGPGVAACL